MLKDRFIISSTFHLPSYNLTKPLTRQDCSHTRCMRILRGEAHPNCCSRGSRAATTLQRRRRTLMEKKLVIRFLATQETQTVYSPGLYIQVHIRVWLPVVECAATWPIKKTKTKHLSQCILHTSCTSSTHLPHILCTPCTSCKYTNTKCLKYIYVMATSFFYIYVIGYLFLPYLCNGY